MSDTLTDASRTLPQEVLELVYDKYLHYWEVHWYFRASRNDWIWYPYNDSCAETYYKWSREFFFLDPDYMDRIDPDDFHFDEWSNETLVGLHPVGPNLH